jgi:hypothetical protein
VTARALLIRPTPNGWAVLLSDGQEVVRFRGLGARDRALRYIRSFAT